MLRVPAWVGARGLGVRGADRVRAGPGKGLRVGRRQASADYRLGENERPVQQAIVASLRPGAVFHDIGANIGFFSLLAARVVGPAGHVYAFEPLPENVAAMQANLARNGFDNVDVLQVALADRAGTASLFLDAHPGGATLSEDARGSDRRLDVRVARLDDLVAARVCAPPDVVKIDVEGMEPAVLGGMARTLDHRRPVVVCEVDSPSRDEVEDKARHVSSLLGEHGYSVVRLPDSYAHVAWEVVHLLARPDGADGSART